MNNNELIASIMLEAADLLRESAGRNGAMRRFYNIHEKDARDKYEKADKEYEDLSSSYEKLDEERENNRKLSFNSRYFNDKYDDARKWLDTSKCHACASRYQLENPNSRIEGGAYSARVNKSAKNGPKNPELHKKINDRAKALKESIDALYEAAYTADSLNEASNYIEKAELLEAVLTEALFEKRKVSDKQNRKEIVSGIYGKYDAEFVRNEKDLEKFMNKYGDDIERIADATKDDIIKDRRFTPAKLCSIALAGLSAISFFVTGGLAVKRDSDKFNAKFAETEAKINKANAEMEEHRKAFRKEFEERHNKIEERSKKFREEYDRISNDIARTNERINMNKSDIDAALKRIRGSAFNDSVSYPESMNESGIGIAITISTIIGILSFIGTAIDAILAMIDKRNMTEAIKYLRVIKRKLSLDSSKVKDSKLRNKYEILIEKINRAEDEYVSRFKKE